MHMVLCTSRVVYTLCRWCHVHLMMCTLCVGGVVFKWYCVHVVHMVLIYMWYCVNLVHDVLRTCDTMYVHYVVMVS